MMLVGVDLGQAQDYTAVAVLEATGERPARDYAVRHLERWLGVAYPDQVTRLQQLCAAPELAAAPLIVDHTGCGRPVVDQLAAGGLEPWAITIHGGDVVSWEGRFYRVPKRDLVGTVAVLLQGRRLHIAAALPEARTLTAELTTFRVTIDPRTAHDSYSAWREQDHDDLVLAVALACWWGERHQPPPLMAPGGAWQPSISSRHLVETQPWRPLGGRYS
jgi:hypothetical protein